MPCSYTCITELQRYFFSAANLKRDSIAECHRSFPTLKVFSSISPRVLQLIHGRLPFLFPWGLQANPCMSHDFSLCLASYSLRIQFISQDIFSRSDKPIVQQAWNSGLVIQHLRHKYSTYSIILN